MKRFTFIFFLFVVTIFSQNEIFAQKFHFDSFVAKNELYSSEIYSLVQDTTGYYWIGSKTGLGKFNGRELTIFDESLGYISGRVNQLLQLTTGTIYSLFENNRILRFNPYTKEKDILYLDSLGVDFTVERMAYLSGSIILIGLNDTHTFLINKPDADILDLSCKIVSFIDSVNSNIIYSRSDFFVANNSVYNYIASDSSIIKVTLPNIGHETEITCLLKDSKSNVWIGTTDRGVICFYSEDSTSTYFNSKSGFLLNDVSVMYETSNGEIWVGANDNGVCLISEEKRIDFTSSNGLPDGDILSVIEDYEGNLLLGFSSGLYIYKGDFLVKHDKENQADGSFVTAICADNIGNLYFGKQNGISIYIKSKDELINISQKTSRLPSDNISFMKTTSTGDVWVGTMGKGIFAYNPESQRYGVPTQLNSSIKGGNVQALDVDGDILYVGTANGLIRYDTKSGKVRMMNEESGLPGNDVSSIFVKEEGVILVGCKNKGYAKIDLNYGIIISDTLCDITPVGFAFDKEGNLYIGAFNDGVYVKGINKLVKHISYEDGLLSNNVRFVQRDTSHNIFVGTSLGLNRISTEGVIYSFTERNGYIGLESMKNSSYRDVEGSLWFGTTSGVVTFVPGNFSEPESWPRVDITNVLVENVQTGVEKAKKLRRGDNTIEFEYACLSVENTDAVRYKMQLEGLEDEWRETTRSSISYPRLKAGRYTFKVIATNGTGIWSKAPAKFEFRVNPPFYKSWWFITILTIILIYVLRSYIVEIKNDREVFWNELNKLK